MVFTLQTSETDVSIYAAVGTTAQTSNAVTAYLALASYAGQNATPIAQAPVLLPYHAGVSTAQTLLFSGLALPAGGYYLYLYDPSPSGNNNDYWQLGPGLTENNILTVPAIFNASSQQLNSQAPWESTFSTTSSQNIGDNLTGYAFTVTGTPGLIYSTTSCNPSPYAASLYNLREQVGANDVGVSPGDQIQTGAYCVVDSTANACSTPGGGSDIIGTATESQSVTLMPANDALNPNHMLQYVPVLNNFPPIGPWTLRFSSSIAQSTSSCNTPFLTDANGVAAPNVAYAMNVSFDASTGTLTPTLHWTEPASFLADAATASGGGGMRIQIWDLDPTEQSAFSTQSAPLQIYGAPVPGFNASTANYSFTVPSSWTTNGQPGYALVQNHPYDIEIQSLLFRATPGSTGNPNVFSRSRVFSDYTPVSLPPGVNTVQLPTPTGSSSGSASYTFNTTVSASTQIFIETPPPTSQTEIFTVGANNPNFQSLSAPSGSVFVGATVIGIDSNGVMTNFGTLQAGVTLSLITARYTNGFGSFELVLPAGSFNTARRSRQAVSAQTGSGGGAAILGLTFTGSGSFTGSVALPSQTTGGGATDGPIPLWALAALGAGFMGIASRRLKRRPAYQ